MCCDLGFGFLGWLCRERALGYGGFASMVVVGLGLSAWVCGVAPMVADR